MKPVRRLWLLLALGSAPALLSPVSPTATAQDRKATHQLAQLSCQGFIPYSVALSPDGRLGLVGGGRWTRKASEGRLWLLDPSTGREVRRIDVPRAWVTGVAFSPDGRQIVSCGSERHLRLWDVSTGKALRSFSTGNEVPLQWSCVGYSPDGRFIVAGGSYARLFDAASGKLVREFGKHRGSVWAVAFSPDGKRLLAGSWPELSLWEVETGKPLRSVVVGNDWNRQVTFSPDGRCLLTGEHRTLVLRRAETGAELRRWEGNQDTITATTFTPDGGHVLSGSYDGLVRLWDIETGKEVRRFEGHTGMVAGLAVTRDGKRVLSAGRDQTIRLWELPR